MCIKARLQAVMILRASFDKVFEINSIHRNQFVVIVH